MKLWEVTRREPLKIGAKVVHLYRFVVLADSDTSAIAKAKEHEVPTRHRDDPDFAHWLTGEWSAVEVGSDVRSMSFASTRPTAAEVAERDARVRKRRAKECSK